MKLWDPFQYASDIDNHVDDSQLKKKVIKGERQNYTWNKSRDMMNPVVFQMDNKTR